MEPLSDFQRHNQVTEKIYSDLVENMGNDNLEVEDLINAIDEM